MFIFSIRSNDKLFAQFKPMTLWPLGLVTAAGVYLMAPPLPKYYSVLGWGIPAISHMRMTIPSSFFYIKIKFWTDFSLQCKRSVCTFDCIVGFHDICTISFLEYWYKISSMKSVHPPPPTPINKVKFNDKNIYVSQIPWLSQLSRKVLWCNDWLCDWSPV